MNHFLSSIFNQVRDVRLSQHRYAQKWPLSMTLHHQSYRVSSVRRVTSSVRRVTESDTHSIILRVTLTSLDGHSTSLDGHLMDIRQSLDGHSTLDTRWDWWCRVRK